MDHLVLAVFIAATGALQAAGAVNEAVEERAGHFLGLVNAAYQGLNQVQNEAMMQVFRK